MHYRKSVKIEEFEMQQICYCIKLVCNLFSIFNSVTVYAFELTKTISSSIKEKKETGQQSCKNNKIPWRFPLPLSSLPY